jgi:hypothetical protein
MKQTLKAVMLSATLIMSALAFTAPAHAQEMREEMREHPRIVKAIHELEEAIKYMEAAPHEFGGARREAIEDSRRALQSLHRALRYREHHDHERRDHDGGMH